MKNYMEDREDNEVNVLLVSDNESDIQDVKNHLEKTMGISCSLHYCSSILRSAGFFAKEALAIDIVLLDLGLISKSTPQEVFQQMQTVAKGAPIIVFTERENHELALMAIDEGAADNVTRGQFSTDPFKLRDTIEFSIARDKISKRTAEKSVTDYKDARQRAVETLLSVQAESRKESKEKDQIINWMSGNYSVEHSAGSNLNAD
jgi:DNA-binding NtrC family response regulator